MATQGEIGSATPGVLNAQAIGNNIAWGGGGEQVMEPGFYGAPADSVLTKYGVRAFDTCQNGLTIGVTTLAHVLANERPRFQGYTRKCTISSAAAEIRYTSISALADPVEKAFSFDMYIEGMITEFSAANPYIVVQICNATSLNANFSRWTFSAQYLRQGWNTIKFRQADTVSAVAGVGNLPTGVDHQADAGTGFDWSSAMQFMSVAFNNMNGMIVHIDEIRRPAKAQAVLTIGFDASGSGAADDIFTRKVAPLFQKTGIRSYCTMTNIYEMLFSGGQAWKRLATLYNTWKWDVINHTWNHGASEVGRIMTLTSLSRTSNVCTATVAGGHSMTVNKVLKGAIQGATPSDMNVITDMTITSSTQFTFTATGADGAGSGTIKFYTLLGEVFTTNTAENLRLLSHEVKDINNVLRACGFSNGAPFMAYPNNSVPELSLMQAVALDAGIVFARAYRGGYAFVNEFGIDNPLNMGSVIMDSGAATYTLSYLKQKVQGAIDRGDHLHIFGHFLVDDEDAANKAYFPVDPEYPPGQGGNPAPPAGVSLTGFGGWWYYSQLRRLVEETIAPAVANGTLLVKSPREYVRYMGHKEWS